MRTIDRRRLSIPCSIALPQPPIMRPARTRDYFRAAGVNRHKFERTLFAS